ncbi:MAG: DUF4382 domain-containing protein [Thiogranum sp.]|nr:DUF4382 domain-containing protein [Thiogranum sp.]
MTRNYSAGLRASILSASVALLLSACGGGGGSNSTGTLNLGITDAPVDEADHVWVEFTGVEIKPGGGNSFSVDFVAPRQIDLLALTGGTAELLLDGYVLDAGTYQWLRLKVNAEADSVFDSYIEIGGSQYELRIPSGDETGLKLNRPITIPEDGTASFTIDFDLRKSVHAPSGSIYILRPTLRLVDNSTAGMLSGVVDPATIAAECVGGDAAAIYVFEGAGATPDDVDGVDLDPVATASVDWAMGDNSYTVAFLEAGDYTAAFTCDASLDDPATDDVLSFTGTTDLTVNAGQSTPLDF